MDWTWVIIAVGCAYCIAADLIRERMRSFSFDRFAEKCVFAMMTAAIDAAERSAT